MFTSTKAEQSAVATQTRAHERAGRTIGDATFAFRESDWTTMNSMRLTQLPTDRWQSGADSIAISGRTPAFVGAVGYGERLDKEFGAGAGTGGRAH